MTKVTIQRDICVNMFVPLTATHNFIPLPPFPPVPPPLPAAPLSLAACAIETLVNAWWPPGYALGANKFTTSVFHSAMTICLDGHDCGKFIPHVQIAPAPNNLLTILHILFSSRKANFSASTVLMNGAPVACMTMIGWPPTPMTYCSDPISMPLASAPTSHLNTVVVGMTFGDWFAGLFAIAAGMLLDWMLSIMGGGSAGFGRNAARLIAQSRAGQSVFRILASEFAGKLIDSLDAWIAKQAAALLVGAVRIAATGQGSLDVSIGGSYLGLKASYTVSRDADGAGTDKFGVSSNILTATSTVDTSGVEITNNHPLGLGSQSVSSSWKGGTTQTTTDISDPLGGFNNRTVTTGPDGTTTIASSRNPSPGSMPNML